MRGHPVRGLRRLALAGAVGLSLLGLSLLGLGLLGGVHAQEPTGRVEVTLEAPPSLVAGDRAQLVAVVRVRPSSDRPVLVTPTHEGTAVEVVRGRMLRADAVDPNAEELRFSVPIVARTPGTSVVRVVATGYACERTCVAVRGEASVVLQVARAPDG